METSEPEIQPRADAKGGGGAMPPSEGGGFFSGPWLRRTVVLLMVVAGLAVLAWLFWIYVVVPWSQVAELEDRGIEVPPEEDPELTGLLGEALSILNQKKYKEARQQFLDIWERSRTERLRTVVEGFVTATYTGTREYREGLDYLCRISVNRPEHDVRHRFGFQAHIRAIAKRQGYEAARELVTSLRTTCPRRDLSYVWAGIPQEKAEYLATGVTLYDEFYRLSQEDRVYLQHVIRDHPGDAFLDHALYFLQKFDRVIEVYPQSLILDVVYRAAAQQAIKAKHYDRAITHLQAYLDTGAKRWPSLPHARQVKILLAKAYAGKGEMKTAVGWLLRLGSGAGPELASLLGQRGPFADAEEVRAFLSTLTGYQPAHQIGDIFDTRCKDQFDLASEALWDANYVQALTDYQSVRDVFVQYGMKDHVPWCVERGIVILKRLTERTDDTKEGLLQLGKELRAAAEELGNPAFEIAAATVWEDCAVRFSRTEEAPKALYLAGAAWRRQEYYERARDRFRDLAELYGESELVDDAQAEVGWYYLFVGRDYALARTYFKKVADADKGNARDNALFWLARTYFEEGDYPRALNTYKELRDRFPYGRLARNPYAPKEISRLEPVVASKAERRTLAGILSLASSDKPAGLRVNGVEEAERKKENGLRDYDVITAVDGRALDSRELLYHLLNPMEPGTEVSLDVIRGYTELTIPGTVRNQVYYKVLPQ